MSYTITPEHLLTWCDAAPALHEELRCVLRETPHVSPARRVATLERAATRLAQILPTEPAGVFETLAIVLIASGLTRDNAGPDGELERLVKTALHGEHRSIRAIFEDSAVEDVAEAVEGVMEQLEYNARLSDVQVSCVQRVKSFAHFYKLEEIARFERTFSFELQPDTAIDVPLLVGAVAVVKAAANFLPVPTVPDGVLLVETLRRPDVSADEEHVAQFLGLLLFGKGFDELAWHVARTRHRALIETFARIAPARAAQLLSTQLAVVAGGFLTNTPHGKA